MKRSTPHFVALALATILSLVVAACSSGSGSTDTSEVTGDPTPTDQPTTTGEGGSPGTTGGSPESLEGIELSIWVLPNVVDAVTPVMEAFTEATGATFEVTVVPETHTENVPPLLQTGAKPDLLFWQPAKSTLPLLQPEINLIPLDDQPFTERLRPGYEEIGTLDGVRYAAPLATPTLTGVYYNKEAFANAGITEVPTTWDELIEVGRQIKAATPEIAPFYEVGGDAWPTQFPVQIQMSDLGQEFWDQLNRNEAKWTDPRIVEAIENYNTDIIEGGLAQDEFTSGTYAGQAEAIYNGTAAMTIQLGVLSRVLQDNNTIDEVDAAVGWFPIGPNGPVPIFSMATSDGMTVYRTGDEVKEAASKQFIDFWLGDYYPTYIETLGFPSIMSDVPSPDGILGITTTQLETLPNAVGQFQVLAAISPNMHLHTAEMLAGLITPEEVASATQAEFEQVARALGLPGF